MFYLYRLFHQDMTLYIGKGSGNRLSKQKRHFRVSGEIIAHFDNEADAYSEEMRLIALYEPPLNRHPGGQGGRAGTQQITRELPNGFTEEGLTLAAPQLARLLLAWVKDPKLVGLLKILGAYLDAHGVDKIEQAVVPHIRALNIQ